MKKLIVAVAVAGSVSLGFTLVNTAPKVKLKAQVSEEMYFSFKMNEKRLASWD